jgi:hypothetical protein
MGMTLVPANTGGKSPASWEGSQPYKRTSNTLDERGMIPTESQTHVHVEERPLLWEEAHRLGASGGLGGGIETEGEGEPVVAGAAHVHPSVGRGEGEEVFEEASSVVSVHVGVELGLVCRVGEGAPRSQHCLTRLASGKN